MGTVLEYMLVLIRSVGGKGVELTAYIRKGHSLFLVDSLVEPHPLKEVLLIY